MLLIGIKEGNMTSSYPLQSSLRGKLAQDFKTFRDKEALSDAEATRQLLMLALRIKLNDSDYGHIYF
ncbi:hypothetical protein VCHA40P238_230004 [Vibrio chagasii]|nr:hypothetical protein VCHA40P238_230004 [Vibrio chagasii]